MVVLLRKLSVAWRGMLDKLYVVKSSSHIYHMSWNPTWARGEMFWVSFVPSMDSYECLTHEGVLGCLSAFRSWWHCLLVMNYVFIISDIVKLHVWVERTKIVRRIIVIKLHGLWYQQYFVLVWIFNNNKDYLSTQVITLFNNVYWLFSWCN